MRRGLSAAMIVGAGFFAAAPAGAGDLEARYAISLAGLSIGKATLSGALDGANYTMSVSSALTGLVGVIAKGRGSATAQGNYGSGNILANGFSFSATNGKDQRSIQIAATSGTVRSVVIEPPYELKDDRIPVRETHKIGVLDPVSALIMPSRTADPFDKANCDRRLPVFDGSQRFDVVLSYAGTRQVKGDAGYSGTVLICSARYVPVAGHRPDRRVTKFMIENRSMDAWLAPAGGGKVLIPYRISVKTLVGTAVIEAESFKPD